MINSTSASRCQEKRANVREKGGRVGEKERESERKRKRKREERKSLTRGCSKGTDRDNRTYRTEPQTLRALK